MFLCLELPFAEFWSSYIYDLTGRRDPRQQQSALPRGLDFGGVTKAPAAGSVEVEKICEHAGKLSLTARLISFKPFRGVG